MRSEYHAQNSAPQPNSNPKTNLNPIHYATTKFDSQELDVCKTLFEANAQSYTLHSIFGVHNVVGRPHRGPVSDSDSRNILMFHFLRYIGIIY